MEDIIVDFPPIEDEVGTQSEISHVNVTITINNAELVIDIGTQAGSMPDVEVNAASPKAVIDPGTRTGLTLNDEVNATSSEAVIDPGTRTSSRPDVEVNATSEAVIDPGTRTGSASDDQVNAALVTDPGTQGGLASNDGANETPRDPPTPSERQLVDMYKAAVKGNWEQAEKLIREIPEIKYAIIMRGGYNALHIATGAQQFDFVRKLMAGSTIDYLKKTDKKGNNAFCIAASAGSVKIAELMLSEESRLLTTQGDREMLSEEPSLLTTQGDREMLLEEPSLLTTRGHRETLSEEPSLLTTKGDQEILSEELGLLTTRGNREILSEEPGLLTTQGDRGMLSEEPSLLTTRGHQEILSEEPSLLTTKGDREILSEEPGLLTTRGNREILSEEPSLLTTQGDREILLEEPGLLTTRGDREILLEEPSLLTTRGNREMLPLCLAAWFGHEEMAKHLYQGERQKHYKKEDLIRVFFASIESGLYGFASTLLGNHHGFALKCDSHGKTVLHLLAQKPSVFTVETTAGSTALKLLEDVLRILKESNSIFTSIFRQLIRRPSHVLFDAVKSGNSEFVVKLIEVCPSLIWERNDRNWTIIHAAVSHRDDTIFNLLQEFGFFKDVIGDVRDRKNGDTLLHLAARLAPTNQLDKLPGAAFQMQRELLWFEKVKDTVQAAVTEVRNGLPQTSQEERAAEVSRIPPPGGDSHHEATSAGQQRSTAQESNVTAELGSNGTPQEGNTTTSQLGRNAHEVVRPQQGNTLQLGDTNQRGNATASQEGKTPQELFTIEHKLLLKEGRKWMNGTAQSCTVVSTLIAGALFAAGITVTLGGNKGTSDHNFQKVVYRIFIMSDAMAFLFALAAILTFLSILTSRYAERDFLESLPSKLRVGLGLLFCSIITMMVAFCSVFIIAYSVEDLLPYLVIEYTVLMVLLCLYMDRSLLTYILKSRFS